MLTTEHRDSIIKYQFSGQQLIILEGQDRSGKTNIALELKKRTGIPVFKPKEEHEVFLGRNRSEAFVQTLRWADPRVVDFVKQVECSVIFDRAFPSEWVYPRVLGRATDHSALANIDRLWALAGARIFIMRRVNGFAGISDDIDPSIDCQKLEALQKQYENFSHWTGCRVDFIDVDDHDLNREVDEIAALMGWKKIITTTPVDVKGTEVLG